MSGEPLLLIHGFTATARTWDPLVPLLRDHHELVVPTLLGHSGGAAIPAGMGNPVAAMADDLERVLDEAEHATAHLVGNSLGGWLSFELALRGRARSLVALCPGHGWPEGRAPGSIGRHFERAQRLAPIGARLAGAIARQVRLRRLAFGDLVSHPERIPPATAAALIRGAADCAIFRPYADHLQTVTERPDLSDIDVPVRIAWSDADRVLPVERCSDFFRTSLPAADWVELPGCGHLPQHDDPALVARTILEVTAPSAVGDADGEHGDVVGRAA